jgi:protocatechuate 3,4-dioxygenase beta subunit
MSRQVTAILLSLAGALTLHVAGHAQDPVPGPDPIVLHGVVTAEGFADTPLRSVRVTVTWTGGETEPVFTDDNGRFSVAIRSGVYHTIAATKAGYAPVRIGREPDSSGDPVAVRMPKGAVITGSVIDSTGAPVSRATVRVRRTDPSGRTYGAGDYQADTDDRGEFRVGSLPAGQYAVVLSTAGQRPVLGDAVQPDSVVDVPAGGERAVLRIDPRVPVGGDGATSYAAGFNAAAATAAAPPGTRAATTGSVQGRVLDELGRPVPAVVVRAFAVTGGTGPVGASDAAGHYEIRNLAAGTYRVVANLTSAPANVVTQSADGRVVVSARTFRVPQDGPGQLVVIGPSEQLTGVDITLQRGAVITGHVVDAAGEPLEGVTVEAWTRRRAGGRTIVEPAVVGSFNGLVGRRTDDRGQFRLFDLPPGTYYLAAVERAPDWDSTTAGRLVFHPSAVSPAMAAPVAVQEGGEAFASITFEPGPLSMVEGQVFDESGEPFQGTMRLISRAREGAQVAMAYSMLVRDGTFRFPDVPPGEYVVQAVARIINGIRLAAIGESGLRFGVAFVSATPGAAASAVVQTGTGSVLRGRVVVEGSRGQPPLIPISIDGVPADPDLSPAELRRARVQPDGSFEIAGLFGPMRFAADLPAGWRLESIYIDGVNAADDPVTFDSAQHSRAGVEVVIARGGAEIGGRISGDPGLRAGALVVAGPGDPTRWHERSRFVKMTTADRDGRFTLTGLPAGQFVVAAIDASTLRAWGGEPLSADDIRFLMSGAANVSVSADGRASVDVRVMQLPE